MKKNNKSNTAALRRPAEAKTSERKKRETALPAKEAENLRLIHELRMHQIELETQNEKLHQIQLELEDARVCYFDMYDKAPVGYLVLSEKDLILEANLTAADLLGVVRSALVKQSLTRFILPEDQDKYSRNRTQLFKTRTSQICELRLVKKGSPYFWVQLEATVAQSADGSPVCRVVLSDITARKQAEEKLQKMEKDYRMLAENSPDLIARFDTRLRHLYVNPAAARVGKLSTSEYIGLTIAESGVPEPVATRWEQRIRQVLMTGKMMDVEDTFPTPEGIRYFHTRFVPEQTPYGSVNSVLSVARDITERKRIEDKLEEDRLLQRTLIDNLPDRVYVMDVQGRKIISNIADWKASGGKTMEDVIGKTDLDIYPPELAEDFWAVDKTVIDSGISIINREEPGLDSQGNPVWVLSSKVPLRDGQGKVVGLVGIGRDITERKLTEKAMLETENRYRTLVEQITAVTYIDAVDQASSAIFMSPQSEVLTGYTPEEWKADPGLWQRLIHPEDRAYVLAENLRTNETGDPFKVEYRIIARDGRIVWIRDEAMLMRDQAGQPQCWQGIMLDITDRKRAELERQVMLEIMQGVASTKDLQEFLQLIHRSIARVIYAENFFVVFYNKNTGLFEEIFIVDKYNPRIQPSSLEKSITSYVYRTGETILLNQMRFDELAARGEVELVGKNFASWMGSPLKTPDEIIGVMAVQNYEIPDCFSEADKVFLTSVSAQVSLVIERKRVEDALRVSEQKISEALEFSTKILDTSSIGILTYNKSGQCVSANAAAAKVLGATVAQLLAQNFHEIPTWKKSGMYQAAARALDTGIEQLLDVHIVTTFGKEVWLSLSFLSFDSAGERHLMVFLSDITERKQVEQALRASEERYQSLFTDSPVALWQEDFSDVKQQIDCLHKEGIKDYREYFAQHLGIVAQCAALVKVVDVNQAALDLHHAGSKEELLTGLNTIFGEEALPTFVEEMTTLAEGKTTFEGEFVQRTLTGDKINVAVRLSVTPGCEETWSTVLVSTTDITGRKRSEEALQQSELKYRRLYETMTDAFVLVEMAGRILECNRTFREMLGYTEDELLQLTYRDITPQKWHAFEARIIQEEILLHDFSGVYEKEYRRKEGSIFPVEVRVSLIRDDTGQPAAMSAIVRDITERKQAEKLQDAIYRIAQATDRAESLETLYPAIHQIIREVMVADNFYIALYDVMNDLLSFPYFVDEVDHAVPPQKPGKGLTEYVLRTGKSLLCDEALNEGLKQRGEIELVGAPSPIWLGVPLIAEGKAIGVMAVQDYKNARTYGEREQCILEFVSSQAAMAIHRKQADESLAQSHEQLRALSLEDQLTGLRNRRGFLVLAQQQLKTVYRARRSMVLLFVDLDGLKQINDTLGHREGDLALIETATVLKETFREADILARLGGDEFSVLALETSENTAATITSRMRRTLDYHNAQPGRRYSLSLSLGVAIYDPENPSTIEELLAQADAHMYEQRQSFRSRGKKR